MSEETRQAVEYVVEERDLNLEPEKFHIVKQAFRVLTALPAYLIVKIKERIKTRKQRKEAKKAVKEEKKTRKSRWRKAFVQRARSRFAHIATISKDFKHNWAMAGMTEEEKEQYRIEHGLVKQEQKPSSPVISEQLKPDQPQESTVIGEPTQEDTEPSIKSDITVAAQGAYASYLESSKTVAAINEQIREELAKGSIADFALVRQYREQLRIEEMNRDNHLEAYVGFANPKTVVDEVVNEAVASPVKETTPAKGEPTPRVSSGLSFRSAVQRVAKRSLVARGTKEITRTMKTNVLKAKKQVVLKAKQLMEQGSQILRPIDPEPEVDGGLKM